LGQSSPGGGWAQQKTFPHRPRGWAPPPPPNQRWPPPPGFFLPRKRFVPGVPPRSKCGGCGAPPQPPRPTRTKVRPPVVVKERGPPASPTANLKDPARVFATAPRPPFFPPFPGQVFFRGRFNPPPCPGPTNRDPAPTPPPPRFGGGVSFKSIPLAARHHPCAPFFETAPPRQGVPPPPFLGFRPFLNIDILGFFGP